jgi:hypothetical protein
MPTGIEKLVPDIMNSLARIEGKLGSAGGQNSLFASSNLQPPSQFFITQDMKIRVRAITTQTLERLTLTAVVLVNDRLMPITGNGLPFTATTDTILLSISVQGFLVSVSLSVDIATLRGQTYATVELLDQSNNFLFTLFSGYLTKGNPLSYPPILIENSLGGEVPVIMYAGVPGGWLGLGTDYAYINVPANRVWKIQAAHAAYTTDGTVTPRGVAALRVDPFNAGLSYMYAVPTIPKINTYMEVNFGVGEISSYFAAVFPVLSGDIACASIGELLVFSSGLVHFNTDLLNAGDGWVACAVWVKEYLIL